MIKAKDIMTDDITYLLLTHNLDEALHLFIKTDFKYIPIMDDDKVIGFMTEIGLLKALSTAKQSSHLNLIQHHKNVLIKPLYVDQNANIGEFIASIVQSSNNRIVVTDKNKPVGIISPRDILKAITRNPEDSKSFKQAVNQATSDVTDNLSNLDSVFKSSFDNSPYMIIAIDIENKIIAANQNILNKLGYSSKEVIGFSSNSIFPNFAHKQLSLAINKAKVEHKDPPRMTSLLKKNGAFLGVEMITSEVRDSKAKLTGVIAFFREVSSGELYARVTNKI